MSQALITEELIQFTSCGNQLDGIFAYPDEGSPEVAILFLSPHPYMGGNMDNNVIRHLARRFSEEAALTLRFNYRGVGKSDIDLPEDMSLFDYWAELEAEERYDELLPDVLAAYDALENAMPIQTPIAVIGYSLGAILSLKVAQQTSPRFVLAISPPNKKRTLPDFKNFTVPVHCIGGEQDFVFDPDALERSISDSQDRVMLIRLPEADHFFRKQEEGLFQQARSVMMKHFSTCGME